MDYTSYFRQIQASLTHCNEFAKKFDKITHYAGNEVYINECTFKLRNIFLSNGFNAEDSDELRKINLFLMLNTNVKYKYDLNEDFKICHLLNNFPQLSKCLLVNLMFQLKLEKYYYEAISFAPAWLVVEFLDETVDSLVFSKSFDVIRQVKDLVEALYMNICRMDYRAIKSEFNDQKLILEKIFDSVSSCLRHYNTPVNEEYLTKSEGKMREYSGYSLNHQLSLILSCFKMFQRKPTFEIDPKFNIYKIGLDKEPEVNNYSNSYSFAVCETLTQINIVLLNTLQNTLLNIALDDFMYWLDIKIEDHLIADQDLKRGTLQKAIGEQAYELIEIMKNDPNFEHNVTIQLSTISMKPQTIKEIAKNERIGTVLQRIEKSSSRDVWLEELLSRTGNLYFNTECLQTIIDNVEIVTLDHLLKILRDHQEQYIQLSPMENCEYGMTEDDENQINEIFLKGGSKLNVHDVKEFIEQLIYKLGADYCITSEINIMQQQEITNYLNKITEENIEERILWNLILQNPQLFFEKLLENIDSQDESQIATILKVITSSFPISTNYIKELIVSDIESLEARENSSRHIFLVGIFKMKILERKEFVKDIFMMKFSQALSSDIDPASLFITLRTLKHLSSHLKITDLLPPLMIQLAQILDKFRWDLMNFSTTKEEIVDTTVSIIQELIKTILINGTKNDKEWIKSKIDNLKSITKFYFQKLSLEKGESVIQLDAFLNPDGFSNSPKLKITSFLCENIVRCTSKEVRKLMNNDILQNFYAEALSLISTIVAKSNQHNPLECLRKCITDYVKILSDILIPSAKTKNQEDTLLVDVVALLKKLPANLHDDLTILFLDSIKELKNCENFLNLISEIEECELRRILLE